MKNKIATVLMILAVVAVLVIGLTPNEYNRYETGRIDLFDTVVSMVGYTKKSSDFDGMALTVFNELERWHRLCDGFKGYDGLNNIKTINDNAGIKPVVVDDDLLDFLEYSKEMYELTDGHTNIALGALTDAWADFRNESVGLPTDETLENAASHTSIDNLIIDRQNKTAFLTDSKARLDVGAIAKGFAVERAAQAAEREGFSGFVISAGGNIKTVGLAQNSNTWNVGIKTSDSSEVVSVKLAAGYSLVTSGDYQRYVEFSGTRYCHIINPKTKYPADIYSSVTVATRDSGLADALSTALFCMDYEQGRALIEALEDVNAMWVTKGGNVYKTNGFPK